MSKPTYTTLSLVKRMYAVVKHLRLQYVLAVSGAVFGFLTTILIPTYIIHLTWKALDGQVPPFRALFVLVLLGLARGLFRYQEHYFGHDVAFKTLYDFRCRVFAKLRQLAPAKLDSQDSGQLLKMIGEDIEAMEVFFAHTVPPIATALVVTVILFIYFCHISVWLAGLAMLSYGLLAIALPQRFATALQPLLAEQSQSRKHYMSLFSDNLRGMKDLIQFGQAPARFQILEEESASVNARERHVAQINHLQTSSSFLVIALSIFAVSLYLLSLARTGTISLETTTTALVAFSTSFAPYLELSRLPLGFKRAINAAREVFELLDEEAMDKSGADFDGSITTITATDLDFSYAHREKIIYEQLSVDFEKGKIIGIIGPSGSGKSTLMKLIMRWYDVTQGQLTLNNRPVSQLDARQVQAKIAYIPQIPQFFSQTIRENLQLGNPAISDDMILAAAEKCRIKDIILRTSAGLDTMLNSEQKIFSAGELQCLELTRALLKNADCYIFDEPTSHLDSLNEAAFLQIIRDYCQGYVFLISHRKSTVSCSDIIYQVSHKQLKVLERP